MLMKFLRWLISKKITKRCMVRLDEIFIMSDKDLQWLIKNSSETSRAVVTAKFVLNMRNQNGLSVREAQLYQYGRKLQDVT